jgi:PadR family transcriptional regulator PadR
MKNLTQLTQLELVLLELVAKGQGKWSWYELASALSRRDVPREPDMMVVLKKLAVDGLVKRYVETNSPRDRWELTPEGSMVLANPKADSQSRIRIYLIPLRKSESKSFAYVARGTQMPSNRNNNRDLIPLRKSESNSSDYFTRVPPMPRDRNNSRGSRTAN